MIVHKSNLAAFMFAKLGRNTAFNLIKCRIH